MHTRLHTVRGYFPQLVWHNLVRFLFYFSKRGLCFLCAMSVKYAAAFLFSYIFYYFNQYINRLKKAKYNWWYSLVQWSLPFREIWITIYIHPCAFFLTPFFRNIIWCIFWKILPNITYRLYYSRYSSVFFHFFSGNF